MSLIAKDSYYKCSNRAAWHLEISLKQLVFILVPGPESELSSASVSLSSSHRKRCHVETFSIVLRSQECSSRWIGLCLLLLFILFILVSRALSPFLLFRHALLLFIIPLSFASVLSLHLSVGSGLHCSHKHIYCVNIAVAKQLKTVTGACQQPARSLVH